VECMPYYHCGILVFDLDAAMARFARLLGVRFGRTRTLDLAGCDVRGRPGVGELRYVYSTQGPPYLELVECQNSGIWGREHGEGLHHIGKYETDLPTRLSELLRDGAVPEAVLRVDGILRAIYLQRSAANSVHVELVQAP
jgi:hypothetical protein